MSIEGPHSGVNSPSGLTPEEGNYYSTLNSINQVVAFQPPGDRDVYKANNKEVLVRNDIPAGGRSWQSRRAAHHRGYVGADDALMRTFDSEYWISLARYQEGEGGGGEGKQCESEYLLCHRRVTEGKEARKLLKHTYR